MRRVFHVRMFRDLTVSEAFLSAFGLSSDDQCYRVLLKLGSLLFHDLLGLRSSPTEVLLKPFQPRSGLSTPLSLQSHRGPAETH